MKLIQINLNGNFESREIRTSEIVRSVCDLYTALYKKAGFVEPWIGYFALKDAIVVGTCGFKGPPKNDRVEIAYFTFPAFEKKGVATEMARQLIKITKETNPEVTVFARTLNEENASTRTLRKLGFKSVGTVIDPEDGEVLEWVETSQTVA